MVSEGLETHWRLGLLKAEMVVMCYVMRGEAVPLHLVHLPLSGIGAQCGL